MPVVCGVRFRGAGKVYHFDPGELGVESDDWVIVSTARGDELGQVSEAPHAITDGQIVGELKPVLRKATEGDLSRAEHYRNRESEVVGVCQQRVERAGLQMKIISAEYSYDGSRLTFYFTAADRVDFRALVRDLARTFRARIDLRQIGVRDEAKLVGGLGPCGRPLCCATWLTQFSPVSIRMAKQQNLPLSPMEISGLCGRLLCCLTYENDYYHEIRGRFPRVGRTVDTPYGPGKVIKVSVLRETVTLLMEDGATVEMTAEQLSGDEPLEPRDGRPEANALANTLQRTAERDTRERRSQPSGDANRGGRDSGQRSSRGGRQEEQTDRRAQGPSGESRASNNQRGQNRPSGRRRQQPAEGGNAPQANSSEGGSGEAPARRSRGRSGRRRRGPRRGSGQAPAENNNSQQ